MMHRIDHSTVIRSVGKTVAERIILVGHEVLYIVHHSFLHFLPLLLNSSYSSLSVVTFLFFLLIFLLRLSVLSLSLAEQQHTLPADPKHILYLARFAGFRDTAAQLAYKVIDKKNLLPSEIRDIGTRSTAIISMTAFSIAPISSVYSLL
jgi:hypothetical protein